MSESSNDPVPDEPARRSRLGNLLSGRRRRWVIGIVLINLLGVLVLAGIGSARVSQCGGGFSGYSGGGGGGCEADIATTQYPAPTPAHVGKKLIYLVTIKNHGPDEAGDISLTFKLPKLVQVNWWMSSAGEYGGGCSYQNLVVNCYFYGGAQKGGSVAATIVIVPTQPGTLRTVATATSRGANDPNPTNNKSVVEVTVKP